MHKKFLQELSGLITEDNIKVSDIEYTLGNYDKQNKKIDYALPTITTDHCEIGIYGDTIYLTFIIPSNTFSKNLFDSIKNINNIQLYSLINFKETLFPKIRNNYQSLKKEILKEKYLQVNFDFNINKISPGKLFKEYQKSIKFLPKINIINQRTHSFHY